MFKSEPTVLCVNERLEQLELFEVQFSQAGYRVLRATDAVGAVEVARRERPDLIVCDVPDYRHLFYHFGVSHVAQVRKRGRVVFQA